MRFLVHFVPLVVLGTFSACSGDSGGSNGGGGGSGGAGAAGGANTGTAGSGGAKPAGTGGAAGSSGSGGASGAGGFAASGGASGDGGSADAGRNQATGGSVGVDGGDVADASSGVDGGGGRGGAPGVCGEIGQPCCDGGACSGGASCVSDTCVVPPPPCGESGQACCSGSLCDPGFACAAAVCTACGDQGEPCCAGACNGILSCTSGTCDLVCEAPLVAGSGSCVLPAPRPIAPLSGSHMNTRLPVLSWELPAGITTAHVEVCADRACGNVVFSSDVVGTQVTVGSTLARGTAYWRLSSVVATDAGASVMETSPVWQMAIPGAHDAPISTAWGAVPDFNGDGRADVVLQSRTSNSSTTTFYAGTPTGLSSTFQSLPSGNPGYRPSFPVSDLDGDGFVDLIVSSNTGEVATHRGSAGGLSTVPSATLNIDLDVGSDIEAGDVNGDGYGDLLISTTTVDPFNNAYLTIDVHYGSPSGVSASATAVTTTVVSSGMGFGDLDTCDVNGDGIADVVGSTVGPGGGPTPRTIVALYGTASGPSTSAPTLITAAAPGNQQTNTRCAGDVNGDGYDDVIDLTLSEARLYTGGSGGLSTSGVSLGSSSIIGYGNTIVMGLGDMNGDGYDDVAIPGTSPSVKVLLGSSGGLQAGPVTLTPTAPNGFAGGTSMLEALAGAGDVNGDGFTDVLFGVEWTSTGAVVTHGVYLYAGGAPITGPPLQTLTLWTNGLR